MSKPSLVLVPLFILLYVAVPAEAFAPQEEQAQTGILAVQGNTLRPTCPPVYEKEEPPTVEDYIKEVFGEHGDQAILIANCESGMNPSAINWGDALITGYASRGLFQINGPEEEGWDNPYHNTDLAWEKFQDGGWSHWKNCAIAHGLL